MCAAKPSWREPGLPAFDSGSDGFPRPGQVVRHFRQTRLKADGKSWTQRDLAQILGCRELAIREMELRDTGLNDILRRRFLAELFAISPRLLGLAVMPETGDKDASPALWWVKLGFPAFDVGPDGFPRPGQVVRHFRQTKLKTDGKPWTQGDLAQILGCRELAIREMELRDTGLNDILRRRVLALLLDIPPVTLGIITLEEILLQQQKAAATLPLARAKREKEATFDLACYKDRLKTLWNRNHTNTAQDRLTQLAADSRALINALPYTSADDEREVRTVLCRYLQLHAHILRDQGRYDAAIQELEKAAILAERAENPPLLAVTLLRIGSVLRDRGDVIEAQAKIEAARGNTTGANQKRRQANADYMTAIDCYSRIRNLAHIPKALHGVLLFDEGYAQAHLAYDNQDARRTALARLKDGGKIIAETRGLLEDEFSIRITERTYHNTKAAVLLAVGWPREALQELTDLMDLPPEGDMARQTAYTDYLWSQAYANLGLIDAAATPAQDAFVIMKQIKSHINMMRIAGLQGQLSQLDSRHLEIIRLGVMVNS